MKHRIWFALLVPAIAAAASAALFASQGGFGGGHGEFDRVIGSLGLPSILLVEHLPIHSPDVLVVLLLPAALNFIVWSLIILVLNSR